MRLVAEVGRREGAGAGSPPGHDQAEADSLEDTGKGANGNGIKRALLSEDLGDELQIHTSALTPKPSNRSERSTYRRSRRSSKNKSTKVRRALVAQSARSLNQSTNTISLEGGAHERSAPGGADSRGLLGLEELLRGVGGLCAAVGLAEDGAEDGEGCDVVEGGAEGDGRWLDCWEVCED